MLCCQPVRSPRAPLTSSQAYMASVSWTRACLSVQSASHDAHRPSGVRGVGARGSRLACSRLERGRDPVGKTAECCDLCGQLGSGLPCAVRAAVVPRAAGSAEGAGVHSRGEGMQGRTHAGERACWVREVRGLSSEELSRPSTVAACRLRIPFSFTARGPGRILGHRCLRLR